MKNVALLITLSALWSCWNASEAHCLCDHRCKIIDDEPTCVCAQGFTMDGSGKCHLKGNYRRGHLLFTDSVRHPEKHKVTGDLILELPLFDVNGNVSTTDQVRVHVPPMRLRHINSLSWCPKFNDTYFLSTIFGDGSNTLFTSRNHRLSMAYVYDKFLQRFARNWVNGNLFYVLKDLGIGMCGRYYCMPPFIGTRSALENVTIDALLIHPRRGRIFWSEWFEHNGTFNVNWAGMDGSRMECLLHGLDRRIQGLTMDYPREHLYIITNKYVSYADVSGYFSGHYKGSSDYLVMPFRPFFVNGRLMKNVESLIIFNDFIYYVKRKTKYLKRIPLSLNRSEKIKATVLAKLNVAEGSVLAIANPTYYEPVLDLCDVKKCSELCVMRPAASSHNDLYFSSTEASCVCSAKKVILPGGQCISPMVLHFLLVNKAMSGVSQINQELEAHRIEMEVGSVGISWALVLTSLPAMILNAMMCVALIHVIVTDYIQYLNVINQ